MAFSRHSTHNLARSTPSKQGESPCRRCHPRRHSRPPWEGRRARWAAIRLIFLFVGKDDPDVKWNAANSLVVFGGLSVVIIILSFIPVVNLLVLVLWLVGFVYWVIFLIQSLQGNGQRIPAPGISGFINKYVDQVAAMVK